MEDLTVTWAENRIETNWIRSFLSRQQICTMWRNHAGTNNCCMTQTKDLRHKSSSLFLLFHRLLLYAGPHLLDVVHAYEHPGAPLIEDGEFLS